MAPTHLLIFDIDGTLLTMDEERAFADAFRERHGLTPDMDWEKYKSCTDWGVACEILEEHLGHPPGDDEVRAGLDHFVGHLRRNVAAGLTPVLPVPGVNAFIHAAAAEGFALSLATGCVESSARVKVEALGLGHLFPVGGYGDRRFDRASLLRDGIAAAQAHHGTAFAPDRICYFGDRTWDVEGARALGIGFIGVAVSPEARAKMERVGARRIIADFAELGAPVMCFADGAGH